MTKFLSYEDRLEIAASLKENRSFGEIGRILGKDRTTIAKEIRKHSYERKSGYSGFFVRFFRIRKVIISKNLYETIVCRDFRLQTGILIFKTGLSPFKRESRPIIHPMLNCKMKIHT